MFYGDGDNLAMTGTLLLLQAHEIPGRAPFWGAGYDKSVRSSYVLFVLFRHVRVRSAGSEFQICHGVYVNVEIIACNLAYASAALERT